MSRPTLRRLAAAFAVLALVLAAGVWIGARSGAAAEPVPGSAADPLVTRSYVTQAISRVLGEAGGRLRTLLPGETFTLHAGTAFVLLAGRATAIPGQAAPSRSGSPGAPAPRPLVDLTTGRPLSVPAAAAAAPVPAAHLLLCGVSGTAVAAGSGGAVIWLLGAQATATLPASPGA